MLNILRSSVLALATATVGFVSAPAPAQAQTYQIDCAILLCLSGGWPASVPCARARAEFIRRITPWPIEPPLQIWRCPMGIAYDVDPDTLTVDRIYEILMEMDDAPIQSFPSDPLTDFELTPQPAVQRLNGGAAAALPAETMLLLAQDVTNGTSDIDISGAEFNFVRSIRVFDVTIDDDRDSQSDGGSCSRYHSIREGSYGTQGNFGWRRVGRDDVPQAFGPTSSGCSLRARAVFVEWSDYEGNYGFERVNY